MQIKKAEPSDLATVQSITEKTISEIYPHYYPKGAVAFFLAHHNAGNIHADIRQGNVFLCMDADNSAVGTVTIKDNSIFRLFVLPNMQGNGYGRAMLDYAEKSISQNYDRVILDASLPAKIIYRRRGYMELESHIIKAEYNDYLCYDVMVKQL